MTIKGMLPTRAVMARLKVTKAMVYKLIVGNTARKGWRERGAVFLGGIWLVPEGLVKEYAKERGR